MPSYGELGDDHEATDSTDDEIVNVSTRQSTS